MVLELDNKNVLRISKNSTITALSSMMNDTTVYVATKVKSFNPSECDVILMIVNRNNEIVSTMLEEVEPDVDNYYKYAISSSNDFSLTEGLYTCYVLLYNHESKTHISSNTVRIMSVSGIDVETSDAFTQNILDEFLSEIYEVKSAIDKQVNIIHKLTELNIKINNDINKKVGED